MEEPALKLSRYIARLDNFIVPLTESEFVEIRRELQLYLRSPNAAMAYLVLGIAYKRMDRHEDAITELKFAIVKNPALWRAKSALATSLMEQGRIDEAERYFQELYLRPEARALSTLAAYSCLFMMKGRAKEACEMFGQAARMSPSSPVDFYQLAVAAARLGLSLEIVELLARMTLKLQNRTSDDPALKILRGPNWPPETAFMLDRFDGMVAMAKVLSGAVQGDATRFIFLPPRLGGAVPEPPIPATCLPDVRGTLIRIMGHLQLKDGWDGEKARAPSEKASLVAQYVAHRLAKVPLIPRVIPDVEGGLGLDFHADVDEAGTPRRYASFLCDNDGDVVVIVHPWGQKPRVWDLELTDEAIDAAIATVRQFLEGKD